MTVSMDLADIKKRSQQEAWVTIIHPVTGVETDMRIQVLSPDSEKFRVADNRIKNSGLQNTRRRGSLSIEEISQQGLDLLVSVTTGWENVIFDGQPIQFSPESVKMLYEDYPFIREQVDRFVGDRRNFFTD